MKAKYFIGCFALLGLIGSSIWVVITGYYLDRYIPDVIDYALWPSERLIIRSLKTGQRFDLFTVYTLLSVTSNVLLYALVGSLVWVGLQKNRAVWLLLLLLATILYGLYYYPFFPMHDPAIQINY